jgi:outer membrane lipopolysaccharide assembly protein LptE/RlpB
VPGSGDWGAVYVSAQKRITLEAPLAQALALAGGTVAAARTAADFIVELAEQQESRRTLSFTDRARTAEYEVVATLRYRVIDRDEHEWVPERQIQALRVLRVDRSNLAASSQEEAILREEITADLVQQVLNSLDAAARARKAAPADADPA